MSVMPKKHRRDMEKEAERLKNEGCNISAFYTIFLTDMEIFVDNLTCNNNLVNKIRRLMSAFIEQGEENYDEACVWIAGFHLTCMKGLDAVKKAPESKKLKERHHARNRCYKLIGKFSEDFEEKINEFVDNKK